MVSTSVIEIRFVNNVVVEELPENLVDVVESDASRAGRVLRARSKPIKRVPGSL